MLGFNDFVSMTDWLTTKENTIELFQIPFTHNLEDWDAYDALFIKGVASYQLADLVLASNSRTAKISFVKHCNAFIQPDKMKQWWASGDSVRFQMLASMPETAFNDKLMTRALLSNHGKIRSAAVERFVSRCSDDMLISALSGRNRKGNSIQRAELLWFDAEKERPAYYASTRTFSLRITIFENTTEDHMLRFDLSAYKILRERVIALLEIDKFQKQLIRSASNAVATSALRRLPAKVLADTIETQVKDVDSSRAGAENKLQALCANDAFPVDLSERVTDTLELLNVKYSECAAILGWDPIYDPSLRFDSVLALIGAEMLRGTSITDAVRDVLETRGSGLRGSVKQIQIKSVEELSLQEALQALRCGFAFKNVNLEELPATRRLRTYLNGASDSTFRELEDLVRTAMADSARKTNVETELENVCNKLCSEPLDQVRFYKMIGSFDTKPMSLIVAQTVVAGLSGSSAEKIIDYIGMDTVIDAVACEMRYPKNIQDGTIYNRSSMVTILKNHGISFNDMLQKVDTT